MYTMPHPHLACELIGCISTCSAPLQLCFFLFLISAGGSTEGREWDLGPPPLPPRLPPRPPPPPPPPPPSPSFSSSGSESPPAQEWPPQYLSPPCLSSDSGDDEAGKFSTEDEYVAPGTTFTLPSGASSLAHHSPEPLPTTTAPPPPPRRPPIRRD